MTGGPRWYRRAVKRRTGVVIGSAVMLAAVVLATVVWDAWRTHRDPLGAYGGSRLVYRVDVDHPWTGGGGGGAAADRRQLVRDTAAAMRARGDAVRWSGRVRDHGDEIEVLLPTAGGDGADGDRMRRFLTRSARLELKLVDDGSQVMRRLLEEGPLPDGVTVGPERWSLPDGGAEHVDAHLASADREKLAAAVAALVERHPLPPDHELLLEGGARGWRTHYVWRRAEIDNLDIADAEAVAGHDDPEVALELTEAGAAKLAAFTARAVGRKMVIVLEGNVVAAPVIMGAIRNGRARIALGRAEGPTSVEEQTRELAAILRARPLPAPLILVSEETVAARR
jgi:preprotein translocase subunit SecD